MGLGKILDGKRVETDNKGLCCVSHDSLVLFIAEGTESPSFFAALLFLIPAMSEITA